MTQFFILDFYWMVHSAMINYFFSKILEVILIVTAAFFQDKDPALFMIVPLRHLFLLSSLGGHG
jgi:hypothetical protein